MNARGMACRFLAVRIESFLRVTRMEEYGRACLLWPSARVALSVGRYRGGRSDVARARSVRVVFGMDKKACHCRVVYNTEYERVSKGNAVTYLMGVCVGIMRYHAHPAECTRTRE